MQCPCVNCGKNLKVTTELAGRLGRCPFCKQTMTFPKLEPNVQSGCGPNQPSEQAHESQSVIGSGSGSHESSEPTARQETSDAVAVKALVAETESTKTESDTSVPADEFPVKRCRVCSNTNPTVAIYCFNDGTVLSTKNQPEHAHVGNTPFVMPFYFSDGSSCDNFNQLAFGCNNHWEEARNHLAEGQWPAFFGGMGRMDLVAAAKQAAQEPDLDRGLSLLLEKFPAEPDFLRPPKLSLQSTEENLGQLTPGVDRTFEVVIVNQGMLLLHGTIWSECNWLVFGDQLGVSQKVFQTRDFYTLKVRVPGDKIRAGRHPLKGEIVIETNGGNMTLPVTAEVPIRPFPGMNGNDSLRNAMSPGELALKAREHPNEAAVLFEMGVVKDWYQTNGWTYPVEGTAASGRAAVQQFYEALGLTKPPTLKVNKSALSLKGRTGQRLSTTLTVFTEESKPVFAHAWCDQNWVELGPYLPLGKMVKILVEILVPPHPGQAVHAQIAIRGNGHQQFTIPVKVDIKDEKIPAPGAPIH